MAKLRVKKWTIAKAQTLFREIEPIATSYGFLLCVAGSVIAHGEGRDLDLVAVPTRSDSDRDTMLRAVADTMGISLPGIRHTEANGISVGLLYESKMIDFFVASIIANQ